MVRVMIHLHVKDYHTWRIYFDTEHVRREKAGISNISIYQHDEDSNRVYIFWDMEDATILQLMFNDPDLVDFQKEAGVISKPIITVLNET